MLNNDNKPKGKWTAALLTFVLGMVAMVGIGMAVKGTDQPSFCASCHSMSEMAWTHKQSVHAQFDCNECHTPYAIPSKLPFKTAIGVHDIVVNTFGTIPNVVQASDDSKQVIQANCRRCHVASTMSVAMDVKQYCTDCHRSVPHSKKIPIDRRKAADV